MKTIENINYQNNRRWLSFLSFGSTLIAILIPKCPLCAVAILSFFGISGFGLNAGNLYPLTFIFILLGLGMLTFRAKFKRNYKPLFLGLIASTIILTEKFLISSSIAFYIGPGLFIVAVLWDGFADEIKAGNNSNCKCSNRYQFRRTKCPK